jgi:RHS repeat-associated protein
VIGRLSGHGSDLGSFTLGYLGQTGQITSRQLASSTLATNWSYLNNTGDRRLAGVGNTGLVAGHFSNFTFTTTPDNFISGTTESSDVAAVYPAPGSQTAAYNNLNHLTNLSGQTLTFDANGNLTSDGQRTYTWDAENRLVGIGYPAQPGKATAFAYDGLSRRATISSTPPGGGSATVTSYLWCNNRICQARNASNSTVRSYYHEGEYVPGAPAQTLYYGVDKIKSVRRVFVSTSSAPAYSYDPYGVPLQVTSPVTNFVYSGMFYNADSGLYLTKYRAYDPVAGRWLSRDPLGEMTDPSSNLYAYVAGDPISLVDPDGRSTFLPWLIPKPRSSDSCSRSPGWNPSSPPTPTPGPGTSLMEEAPSGSPDIDPADVAGKTPAEIDKLAKEKGLLPQGSDPMIGKGSYVDPVTGKQRILIHPDEGHAHVNDPSGQRLGPTGEAVHPNSPEAHLPLAPNP